MLLYLESVDRKLVARVLSWKSNTDLTDGSATHFPRLPRDGHQPAKGNLIGQKPPDACHT